MRIGKVKGKCFISESYISPSNTLQGRDLKLYKMPKFPERRWEGQRELGIQDTREVAEMQRKIGTEWPSALECLWSKGIQKEWMECVCNTRWMIGYTSKLQLKGQDSRNAPENHPLFIPKQELIYLPAPQGAFGGMGYFYFFLFFTERRMFSERLRRKSSCNPWWHHTTK